MQQDNRLSFRLNSDILKLAKELMNKKGYDSISHVVRCAIIKLHRSEVLENESTR